MTDITSGAGIVYPSESPELTLGFSEIRVTLSLVFCVVFFVLHLYLFLLNIVLSVLPRFTVSDPFDVLHL